MKRYSYKPGEWNVLCAVCGFRFPASKIRTRWDGVLVCPEDYETRHPQDLIRIPQEDTSIPYSNPEVYTFIEGVCTEYSRHPYANLAAADCAIIGWSTMSYEQLMDKYFYFDNSNYVETGYLYDNYVGSE